MKTNQNILSNNNKKNLPSDENYQNFNDFIFSNDIKIMGKLLHRFQHFLNVKDLPGDIVEVGVFKGSGVSSFLKFNEIFCPNSNKKVVGFDIFDVIESKTILKNDKNIDRDSMNVIYNRVDHEDLTLESVTNNLFGDSDDGVSAKSPAKVRFPELPIALNRLEKF